MLNSAAAEYRSFQSDLALGENGEISGIAWPFNAGADRYGDTIEPSAFKSVIGQTLPMLFAHSGKDTVGVWPVLKVTDLGFEVAGRLLLDSIARAKEVASMIRAGAVRGISIGFIPKSAKAKAGGGRHYTLIDVFEVSLVSSPAHPAARITNFKDAERAARLVSELNRATEALRA